MATMDDFFSQLGSGLNLANDLMGLNTANNVNAGVQQGIGQNSGALAQTIADLQRQLSSGNQISQQAYDNANSLMQTQNQGLQGNIDTMTTNLNALSDPNSPYMQMARQKIERADAAAGRRSQVGEREVQLAAMLADYVGKYAPGLNNSITGARNQINSNSQSLADIYARMQAANIQRQQAMNQALQTQQAGINQQNQAGRQAQNSQTFNTGQVLQGALGLGRGLYNLFGSNAGDGSEGQQAAWMSPDASYGGLGSGISSFGLGTGSLGNFGDMGSNNFFGGGNLFGDYGGGSTFGSDLFNDDLWSY